MDSRVIIELFECLQLMFKGSILDVLDYFENKENKTDEEVALFNNLKKDLKKIRDIKCEMN